MAAATSLSVPWDRLRSWITIQEDMERQTGRPAPLTPAQVNAIANLVDLYDEPDVSAQDFVSLLCQKLQRHRMPLPEFTYKEPIYGTSAQVRWRCICDIRDSEGIFPRVGQGIDPGKEAPSFQSKKNAKQYAAKHALEFLMNTVPQAPDFKTIHSAPPVLRSAPFSPPPASPVPPSPKASGSIGLLTPQRTPPQKRTQFSEAATSFGFGSEGPLQSPSPPSPSPDSASAPAPLIRRSRSSNDSLFEQVATLATLLGFDQPGYQIEPEMNRPGFFRGEPIFSRTSKIPLDLKLGHVQGVFGRKQTKSKVAEKVLEYLQQEQRNRDRIKEDILAG